MLGRYVSLACVPLHSLLSRQHLNQFITDASFLSCPIDRMCMHALHRIVDKGLTFDPQRKVLVYVLFIRKPAEKTAKLSLASILAYDCRHDLCTDDNFVHVCFTAACSD